tara:strand:+ start:226 stop:1146 length:921 start_codon:yes stop_codon:yes gene_type:complete
MLKISFTDFWIDFNEKNNLITNILNELFNSEILVTKPNKADVCFVSICGKKHKKVIEKYNEKCILFLGENIRPNKYKVPFSLTSDFNSYGGTNMRLPLWYFEIDWFRTNIGIIKVDEIEKKLINYGQLTADDIANRKDCITIFNNPEGSRMDMLKELEKIMYVEKYGTLFNNPLGPKTNNSFINKFFPVYSDYQSKIEKMTNFKFNFCPENSLFPGYYTEKCFHAKIAGCIPIYFADYHVHNDFRKESFINMYDYLEFQDLSKYLSEVKKDYSHLAKLANEPLLKSIPKLNSIKDFLLKSITSIRK